jgi:hypothetical protein
MVYARSEEQLMALSLKQNAELFESSFGRLTREDTFILGLAAQRAIYGTADIDGELDFIVLQECRED